MTRANDFLDEYGRFGTSRLSEFGRYETVKLTESGRRIFSLFDYVAEGIEAITVYLRDRSLTFYLRDKNLEVTTRDNTLEV